jgi:hypothetical protein
MLIKQNSNNLRMPPLYIYILYGRLTLHLFFNLEQEVYIGKNRKDDGFYSSLQRFLYFTPHAHV